MSSLGIEFLIAKMTKVGFVDLLELNIFSQSFKSVDTNTYLALKLLTC